MASNVIFGLSRIDVWYMHEMKRASATWRELYDSLPPDFSHDEVWDAVVINPIFINNPVWVIDAGASHSNFLEALEPHDLPRLTDAQNSETGALLPLTFATYPPMCERTLGTVFQLPSPDAIYNQDKEKERRMGGYPVLFEWAHGPRAAGGRSERLKEATRSAA
ncbi:hypothetical protein EJ02DRAFT_516256 [Clathrospora elynae]|uniref:Uncharacterized protein n=1 Tax=Clathrospora elynae TaxID=706981 RepID=A0A6A5S812_9PLEO|nr:hypothetical protein EJ02DRAFT_516256 [Clathrospora elynae]